MRHREWGPCTELHPHSVGADSHSRKGRNGLPRRSSFGLQRQRGLVCFVADCFAVYLRRFRVAIGMHVVVAWHLAE